MEWNSIPKLIGYGKYSVTVDWNDLDYQLQRFCEYNLDLDPDFQREHVWSKEKQIAYVEYILKGGTQSRDIIFNHSGWGFDFKGNMLLIDGKQRLQAARLFLDDRLPIFGSLRSQFTKNGRSFTKLPGSIMFRFYINNLKTRAEILQFYLDLNKGGVIHSNEEIDRVRCLLRASLRSDDVDRPF